MTHNEMLQVNRAMRKFGGSFVRALAEAWLHADEENFAKIEATWPEYIAKYKALVPELEQERF